MEHTQIGRDFGTNSRRKSTRQMYTCRLLPSSRILRSYWRRKLGQQLKAFHVRLWKPSMVRTDDNWQDWEFPHLLEALRKWTTRNPPKPVDDKPARRKHSHPSHWRRKLTRSDDMTRVEGRGFIVKAPTTSPSTVTRSRQSTNAGNS